ncbi:MAG TPA: class I SAM-dependent methyltransferase [Gemmatimonadaceae bacterium]|nr:class I SAM-dependent methyltransferase [Gemmatimonadaceae bacterium]
MFNDNEFRFTDHEHVLVRPFVTISQETADAAKAPAGQRTNLLEGVHEHWRPPPIGHSATRQQRIFAGIQRFVDLQYGSITNDLTHELRSAHGTVLDVGCGGQPFRSLLPTGVNYVGIDIVDARERFGYMQPDTISFSGNVWPVETGSVDLVLCTETLEHVIDPDVFLSEAHRCLKQGGRLVLTVPFAARWHFIPYDYWRFTPSGMRHLLSKAGFDEIRVLGRGNSLTVACYKVMTLYLAAAWPYRKGFFRRIFSALVAIVFSPLFLLLAVVGNFSLRWDGANDYLGLTVTAKSRQAT